MKPYHRNPRQITKKSFNELKASLKKLGDLGGIVHNVRTDEIIGGNQRENVFGQAQEIKIIESYDKPDEQGTIAHGFIIWNGAKYAYRQVDWDEETASEANIRANLTGGTWDFDVFANAWEPTELTAWGFDVDLLSDWRRDVAALGDFLESEEEFEKPEGLPNPRNLPIDVIFTMENYISQWTPMAYYSGIKWGIQSNKKVLSDNYNPHYDVTFVDNVYTEYIHSEHVAVVKRFNPKYATVRDIMTKSQCSKAGITWYSFERIMEWAEELSEHAENVIVIPKYDCLDKIPDKFMLGYSVPTSHGGTPLPPESFKGRRVHLLGGSWKNQLAHLAAIGDDVISLDNNHCHRIAEFGQFYTPDGGTGVVSELLSRPYPNGMTIALAISFGAIGAKINELYRPPDGGNGTENFNMVVTATNHKKQGDFVECHNEPSIVLFWYVLLMLPRKCWQTSPA